MKRITFLIALCLALSGQAKAQRYLPGGQGIQLTAGAVDGFKLKQKAGQVFSAGIALSTYTKHGNCWVLGGEYLQKQYGYKEWLIPVSQFTAEGGYYLKFLSDPSKTFFFSLGTSVVAGYETINWSEKRLFDGATITNDDNFLCGGAVTFEIETYLTDRLVLLLNARERIVSGSSVNKFHFQGGIGIKVIIN